MNDFHKTFVLTFYNSFLKIKFNYDKENMLILNTCSFQKKILSKLTCALIGLSYLLTRCVLDYGSENSVKLTEIYPCWSLHLRKLKYLESPLFE